MFMILPVGGWDEWISCLHFHHGMIIFPGWVESSNQLRKKVGPHRHHSTTGRSCLCPAKAATAYVPLPENAAGALRKGEMTTPQSLNLL